ncbi:MAG: methionyl-tRNA formyltransferase [Achromobacter veterisilvae]
MKVKSDMASIAILGSTDVTISVANAVIEAGHRVAAIVYVPADFSISYSATPVNIARAADIPAWCQEFGAEAVPYEGPESIYQYFQEHRTCLCIVAGWYHLVPARIRALFEHGAVGFHASLLPQLRGGAPLNWAILAGLRETGVTMFQLADGVDDGLVFAQSTIAIGETDYVGDLVRKSGHACFALVRDNLTAILNGTLRGREQFGVVSYGLQRSPEDGKIDWTRGAGDILRLVRAASYPYPGAYTYFWNKRLTIWRAEVTGDLVHGAPGQIFRLPTDGAVVIVTGSGLLRIIEATDAKGADMLPTLRKASHQRCDKHEDSAA